MNTQSNKNFSILLLLAGTLLVGFSMGRWLAPLAAWIGPILIMRYARDHKVGRGYLLVLAACLLAVIIGFIQIWVGADWPPPLVASTVRLARAFWICSICCCMRAACFMSLPMLDMDQNLLGYV